MAWISKLASRYYSSRSYDKGRQYFLRGCVHIVYGDDESVEATVQGTSSYAVQLRVTITGLAVSCSCPWFKDTRSVCKHVWAAIVAADRQRYLSLLSDVDYPTIETAVGPSAGTQPPAETPAEWRRRLAPLRRAPKSPQLPAPATRDGAERQLCYLIDVERSKTAGDIILRIASRRRKKNGEWGKIPPYDSRVQIAGIADADDRRIVALMQGAKEDYYSSYSYEPDSISPTYRITGELGRILIPEFCRTGRCFLVFSPDDLNAPRPAFWDDGVAWSLDLKTARNESAGAYVLSGSLARDNETMALQLAIIIGRDFVISDNRIGRFEGHHAIAWSSVLSHGPIAVPVHEGLQFVAELFNTGTISDVKLPPEIEPQRMAFSAPPILRIRGGKSLFDDLLEGELLFVYGDQAIPWDSDNVLLRIEENRPILRDHEAEKKELARLSPLGFQSFPQLTLLKNRLPEAARALLAVGWRIEAQGKPYRRPSSIRIEVTTGIDWFELHGAADFDGQTAVVPDVLRAIRRGETIIQLADGSVGLIPEEWMRRYGVTAAFGALDEGTLRFNRGQAGLLDALLASNPDVSVDAEFARIREQFCRFEGIVPANAPKTLRGKLREYQRDGLGWLKFLREFGLGGCLADDMGLGKTIQVLALLESLRRDNRKPSLVVAPKSLVFNWRDEIARFTPKLRVLDHTGMGRIKSAAAFDEYDVVLTTYGIMRRDILLLKDIPFDTIVLDEAQAIKNPQTDSAKASRVLRSDHKLALTGTPVENHLGELWSLFEFLNPGLLGTASAFNSNLAANDETSREILRKALRPFILRRTKSQVAKDLPPKLEQTIFCEMDKNQKKIYEELRDYYRQSLLRKVESDGLQKSKMHVLEALLRLRQAACHPALIDPFKTAGSAKLDALIPQITEVIQEGHKILVFSQFTSFLKLVREALERQGIDYEYLDGQTADRAARVERFQTDASCPLFLISLKAGGLGLNLTAADYVFLLDPWWNPAAEAQAIDRAHRIGQSRHVFAYRLITRNTVEERVLELQQTKRDLADAIIGAENSVLRGLTKEHLELLLR